MAVTSRELKSGKGAIGGKLVACAAWGVAVWATVEFLNGLTDTTGNQLFLWAAFLQAVMTWGESPVWSGKARWWNIAVLAIDTIINIGGLFFFVLRLDKTESWEAFNQALGTTGGINPLAALVVSAMLGLLLAASPEFLWKQS